MHLTNGVTLNFIKTKKFKDIGISIRFRSEIQKELAPARSILALMLCDRCQSYNTKQKMSMHQDEMYGAGLSAQTAGYGASQIVEIKAKIINPSFLEKGNSLLRDIFQFLNEIIFHPLLNEEIFQESKQILCAKIDRMMDEPSQYAITQGLKLAGKDTPLGLSAVGEEADIEKLTLQDIVDVYQDMVNKDIIDIMICGDIHENQITKQVKELLPFSSRENIVNTWYCVNHDVSDEKCIEYKNISQSYIMMIWFTNISILDPMYYPLRVANAMLGQYSTSLLFQEVREKHSLCYSIFSNLISYDGALGVTTGIEKENIDQTVSLINTQFSRLQNGDFDDRLIDVSRQMIINSLKASDDNMNSLIAQCYQNLLLGKQRTTQDLVQLIEQVTRDEIIEAISKSERKMTFIVTKEDQHEER